MQQERVRAYIQGALQEGAKLVTGGVPQPDGLPRGFFVRPTVLVAEAGTTIEQEEVFGPPSSHLDSHGPRTRHSTPQDRSGGQRPRVDHPTKPHAVDDLIHIGLANGRRSDRAGRGSEHHHSCSEVGLVNSSIPNRPSSRP
ncbi:aldehyde dehydrogenase family protein [Saccharopolyspora karakumensis]|uniref:Aldehyde dehydrogenase family protein n=1 Tax=Saccharopolyspora karakumensis TaxID=2530386 RepID=A0A4R5BXS3_9PSEU|nr:aldehyde dehydrogenase family protein [Saccharopolyspora karakumensis]